LGRGGGRRQEAGDESQKRRVERRERDVVTCVSCSESVEYRNSLEKKRRVPGVLEDLWPL